MTRPFNPVIAAFVASYTPNSAPDRHTDADSAGAVVSSQFPAPAQPTKSARDQWIADEIRKAEDQT